MQLHRWIMLLTQEKDREEMNDQLENAGLEADVDMLYCSFAANAFVQCSKDAEDAEKSSMLDRIEYTHYTYIYIYIYYIKLS